jgi:hypothetical protein
VSFYNESHVKRTRHTRRCDWCGEMIHKGDPSVAVSGIYDGDFFQSRYHPECNAATHRWASREGWGEPLPNDLMNRGGIEEKGEPETEPIDTVKGCPYE